MIEQFAGTGGTSVRESIPQSEKGRRGDSKNYEGEGKKGMGK